MRIVGAGRRTGFFYPHLRAGAPAGPQAPGSGVGEAVAVLRAFAARGGLAKAIAEAVSTGQGTAVRISRAQAMAEAKASAKATAVRLSLARATTEARAAARGLLVRTGRSSTRGEARASAFGVAIRHGRAQASGETEGAARGTAIRAGRSSAIGETSAIAFGIVSQPIPAKGKGEAVAAGRGAAIRAGRASARSESAATARGARVAISLAGAKGETSAAARGAPVRISRAAAQGESSASARPTIVHTSRASASGEGVASTRPTAIRVGRAAAIGETSGKGLLIPPAQARSSAVGESRSSAKVRVIRAGRASAIGEASSQSTHVDVSRGAASGEARVSARGSVVRAGRAHGTGETTARAGLVRVSWKYWLIRGGTEHETDSFFIPAGTGAEVRVFPRSRRQPGTPLEARTTKRLTPPLRVTLRQQNPVTGLWAPADLTGVDRILFRMIDSFGNVVVHDEAASVVGDPTEGMAEYSWRERDVDTAGIYFGRWRVDWESHHEKPLYFPLTSEHLIQIGPTWEQLSMEGGPPARDRFSWAVDTDRGKGVIFGGFDGTDNLNDLWEIDLLTGAWTKIVTTGTPSTRRLTEMAYDSSNKVFWLFGGTAGPVLDELWKYDPATSTFTQVVLTPGPPPLWSHAMEYDPDRKLILLFGGFGAMQIAWVFDVVLEKWTEILGPGLPPGRGGTMIFFNTTTRRITMFAGNGATSGLAPLSDLWDFDGSAFTQIGTNPQKIPASPRTRTQGTWDPVREKIFLFGGGTQAGPIDDTWEREEDSGIWSEVDSGGDSFAPPPRRNGAIFRHPQGSVFTIFGGQSEVPSVVLGDSWKYTVAERDVAGLIGG